MNLYIFVLIDQTVYWGIACYINGALAINIPEGSVKSLLMNSKYTFSFSYNLLKKYIKFYMSKCTSL